MISLAFTHTARPVLGPHLSTKQSSFLSLGTESTHVLLYKKIWNRGHFFKDEHLLGLP